MPKTPVDADRGSGRDPDDYRPLSPRRRLLVALLALATAAAVMGLVLEKPGGPPLPGRAPGPAATAPGAAATPVCATGMAPGCVGGPQRVLPPQATATAAGAVPAAGADAPKR